MLALLLFACHAGDPADSVPVDGDTSALGDSGDTDTGDADSGGTDSGDTGSGDTDSGDTDSGDSGDSGHTDSGDSGSGDSGDTGPVAVQLAVPAYFYPGATWTTLSSGGVALAIANPASGPGATIDPNYTAAIGAARAAGVHIIGYVHTSYGARPSADVEAEIRLWRDLYGVDGIFFDEAPGTSDCAALASTYAGWAAVARASDPSAFVALNPGTDTCASYLDFADVLVVFEGTAATFGSWSPPAWGAAAGPDRLWTLIYAASSPTDVLAEVRARGVGWAYVTDDDLPNPWDTLPPYWADELRLAAGG